MAEHKVTPWEVEGKVDYDKLIKEFGVQYISDDQRKRKEEAKKKNLLDKYMYSGKLAKEMWQKEFK